MKNPKREIPMLMGPLERPALQWLAARMPAWVTPDILTVIGFLGAVLIFASYLLTNINSGFLWLASLGFAISWFGDSLDGTLARYRHIERPQYGFFVDHTTDALAESLVFFGLGLSPYVHFNVAAVALVGYLLASELFNITTIVSGVFRIAYFGIGPTEMRTIAIISNAILFFLGRPMFNIFSVDLTLYDLILCGVIAFLYISYIIVMITKSREFARIDPPKK